VTDARIEAWVGGEKVIDVPRERAPVYPPGSLPAPHARWGEHMGYDGRAPQHPSPAAQTGPGPGQTGTKGMREMDWRTAAVVKSGANVKVAQELARHSTPTLTLGRYAHIGFLDRAKALAAPPSIDTAPDGREASRATGTDGEPVSDDDEPSACSVLSSRHRPGMPSGAPLGKATILTTGAEPGKIPVSHGRLRLFATMYQDIWPA